MNIDQLMAMTNGVNAAAPEIVAATQAPNDAAQATQATSVNGTVGTAGQKALHVAGAVLVIMVLAVILRHVADMAKSGGGA